MGTPPFNPAVSVCVKVAIFALAAVAQSTSSAATKQTGAAFFDDFKRLDLRRWYVSHGWANGSYQNCTWSRNNLFVRDGILRLSMTQHRNALRDYQCAEVQSRAVFGYGVYETRMRAASGSGLNSSMFTYSGRPLTPVHDEIDFEVLGRRPGMVQLNYFVNGRSASGSNVRIGNDGSKAFNHYAFEWRPGVVRWFINGRLVWTANDASMPRTPGKMYFSLWAGSASKADWLGHFDPSAMPARAEIDWAAFTPIGRSCLFPQSITCRTPR